VIRINRIHERSTLRLIVEGTLSGVWVTELEKCWLEAESSDDPIRVELSGVGYIDDSGKKLLKQMVKKGAQLHATGVMTKGIIEEIISQNGK
jgi:anti-anti-sigma regulatory factor